MIRIFVTGGTFDKEYNELTGSLFFKDTHLPEMLRLGRSRIDVSISTLMMLDSLEMTAADRTRIVDECGRAAEQRLDRPFLDGFDDPDKQSVAGLMKMPFMASWGGPDATSRRQDNDRRAA